MRRLSRHLGEVLLALVLCLGAFMLVGMTAPIATNMMAGRGAYLFDRRVVFDNEGRPRIEITEYDYSHKQRRRNVTWYDLEWNKIGTYPMHQAPRLALGGIVDLNTVLRAGWRGDHRADLTGWRYLPPPGLEVPIWHKLPYRGLLVGYIYPQGHLIGYIGRNGFIAPGETGEGFVDPRYIASVPKLGDVWVDGDRVYAIDLDRKTVLPLWKSPSGAIRALGFVNRMGITICGNTIRVIDPSLKNLFHGPILEGPLPEKLRENVAWQVAWHKDRLVISNLSHRHAIVYHLSPTCEIMDRWELDVPVARALTRTRMVALTVASSIMAPWAGALIQQLMEAKFPEVYRLIDQWLDWPYQPPFLAISLVLTLLSAVLVWWHLRARSTTFQMVLGVCVALLFSWPGYVVGRSLFEVDARVPCPACGRRRATSQPKCPHCKARWPAPIQTGCEILLPA